MNIEDLYESNGSVLNTSDDVYTQRVISSRRTPRVRLKNLLRLRRIRERTKLEKLKDMELYYLMYGTLGGEEDSGGGMF